MTPQLLTGKICAITGGVTGIGRAIALEYIAQGARVAVNHFGDAKSAEQFQSMFSEATQFASNKEMKIEDRLIEVPGDISQQETGVRLVQAAVEKWGRLDVFVSNAGVCEFSEFLECGLSSLALFFMLDILCSYSLLVPESGTAPVGSVHLQLEVLVSRTNSSPPALPNPSSPRQFPSTSRDPSTPPKPPHGKCPHNNRQVARSSGSPPSARSWAAVDRRTTRPQKRVCSP